jgi:UDPglucose 6-dehydrogenase
VDEGAVSIVGLGRLGSPIAACLAARGLRVVGVDVDEEKVRALAALLPPVFEPGLEELLARSDGRLAATTSVADAVARTGVTMVVVPTPSDGDGGFSLGHVLSACEEIGRALAAKDGYHVVAITSTVMPGATGGPLRDALEAASGKEAGVGFGLCYSPEFVALGSVVHDFLEPDFVLVGESDERAGDALCAVYARLCENAPPVARLRFVEAELAKLAVNSFVTAKISFANMLARICEQLPDADVDAVTGALGLDSRIGSKYLTGAVSYGGPCFPRDNAALAALARSVGAPADLPETTDRFNRAERVRLCDRVLEHAGPGSRVAVLGLAYKPGSDVVDESPGLALARDLAAAGVEVAAFDPAANGNAAPALEGTGVRLASSLRDCLADADAVVVATPWPEFRALGSELAAAGARPRVVVDCWRLLDPGTLEGTEHVPLGTGGRRAVQDASV